MRQPFLEQDDARHILKGHRGAVLAVVFSHDGKMLAPGVVTHSTPLIEHPQLVADRIQRFAKLVGRENVIGSTDCGLGLRLHPSLAWAKLHVLTEGAKLASATLWGGGG